jgi:DNA-binding IclR family transcriptional regulator
MTRVCALLGLLEHGPLSTKEVIEITGWPAVKARKTIGYLSELGRIKKRHGKWVL